MSLSFFAIFGAGVLSFASPCVLPLIPIYLATILGGSLTQASFARAISVAAAFATGLSVVFVTLGALASTFGAALIEHRPWIMLASGLLMLLFGLRTTGVLTIRALDVDARPALARVRTASSLAGAFVFGGAFALGWSPCMGPVLSSVLTFAAVNAQSPWVGAGYLAVYAAGFSLPLLVIAGAASTAPQLLNGMRRAIPRLERATGAALLAIGGWTLASATALLTPPVQLAASVPAEQACPADTESASGCALPAASAATGSPAAERATGPRMFEFSTEHCPTCQQMKPVIDALAAGCTELSSLMQRVDVASAGGLALAQKHGVLATPTFVFVDEDGHEQARLFGATSAVAVAAAAERAFGFSCAVPG
ncbi:MAG: cytochrome c biogenesis protein CcdA [Candidatus Binatia bacterium]